MNKNEGALNDRMVKSICIPALGIIIPNLSGLITNRLYSYAELVLCYLFFIVVAWLVWQGNVWLMYFIRKRYTWSAQVYYKIIISLFFANIVYSGILSAVLLNLWKMFSRETYSNTGGPLVNTILLIIIAACFITNIYEIIFLNQEREYSQTRVEQLNIAKAQAELEALKNQIDPHFIFNSLNTLSFLITRDPQNARLYNDTLAKVYRYILSNKDKDLVLLREEIEFISNYFYLLKIRFADAISMVIEITDLSSEDYLIPPISVQALIENAIKHNEFNDRLPLTINISISSNYVIVRNIINPKNYAAPTSKIGLGNLDNRYKLITKRNIIIENNFKSFTVKLPIIKF
ncbi:MAG: histidine kinase [Bacteroidota bacterium]|nr:histidine kinase [Bacteroidota bacterium]MDP4215127.1 histidine kinase [Bacteroidota bacterium]MDP4254321.1 histidine kinase [Bacteroidota bacterium]MDP4258801.1 histidine kinase [Bacteroidota bacterium]